MKLAMFLFGVACLAGAIYTHDRFLGVYSQIWIVGSMLKED